MTKLIDTKVLAGVAAAGALLLGAAPASALSTHAFTASFGSSGSGDGQVSSPRGVAVNDATGDVYVADTGNQRVDEFTASGTFVRAFGADVGGAGVNVCTSGCVAGTPTSAAGGFKAPTFIAVDNSGGPSAGDVYVADTTNLNVQKFDPSGGLVTSWGSGGQLNGSSATGGPFTGIAGITTSPSGQLFVYDNFTQNWFEFAQDGTPQTTLTVGRGTQLFGIATDAAGNLYKVVGNGNVEKYDASGNDIGPVDDFNTGQVEGFAIDPATGDIYLDKNGTRIEHYASSCVPSGGISGTACTPADTFGSGHLTNSQGLAVDSSNQTIYASDLGADQIDRFDPAVLPDVTTGSASNLQQHTATLNGTVNPGGVQLTDCHFEYVTIEAYLASGFTDLSSGGSVPCAPPAGSIPADSADHDVSADLSGLTSGHIYYFRLVAANATGQTQGRAEFFETAGLGFGVKSFDGSVTNADGSPDTQAGSHPFQATTSIALNMMQAPQIANGQVVGAIVVPDHQVKDLSVDLPAGFVGNPTGIPQCPQQDLVFDQNSPDETDCPLASQVGVTTVVGTGIGTLTVPVFNMTPPPGVPAQFGAMIAPSTIYIDARVRSGGDYGLTAEAGNISTLAPIYQTSLTFWGVPGDPAHDAARGEICINSFCTAGGNSSNGQEQPFLTLPTSCAGPQTTTLAADSWQNPGKTNADGSPNLSDPNWKTASFVSHDNQGHPIGVDGCDRLQFNPSISVQPDTTVADSPSGLSVDLSVPQAGLEDPNGLAAANLKQAVVTLPAGVSVDPSSADGLAACSPAQIALGSSAPATCPDASKIGTVEIDTPLLDHPIDGGVFLARQTDNPFGSLLAIYIAVADPQTGIVIKLAGHVVPDPVTGQLQTTFDNNPQLPFTDLKLQFKGGPRGVLATPESCGTFTTTTSLTPWSGTAAATPSDSFSIDSGCVSGFAPSLTAGTTNPQAGAFSPFVLSLSRSDTDQNFSGLSVKLPPGVLAKLAGVQECSEQQLASISSAAGTGANALANPSCPAGSQVGTVETGSGVGPSPFFLGGKAYLTGPYKGAPYGLAVVVPAVAGPLDLGTVVVRQALYIDPTTAQVSDVSDPFPTILQGIPLRIRRIDVTLDRPSFTLNPTSCNPTAVSGTATSTGGLTSNVSSRFQVGGCQSLGFSPKLKIALTGKGKTRSGDHPTLTAALTVPSGQANLGSARVALPLSLALDPNNSQHVCNYYVALAVHGGAVGCPASTIVGQATAVTPLLSQPLGGPVYLVQGIRFNAQGQAIHTLPSLLIPLRGQIALDLRAQSSVSGGKLVTTFSTIPDAPVSKFTLTITGGPKGLLVITGRGRTICGKAQMANGQFGAQSGKAMNSAIKMSTPCPVKRAKKHGGKAGKKGAK